MTIQVGMGAVTTASLAVATTTTVSFVSTNKPLYARVSWYGNRGSVGTITLNGITYGGTALTKIVGASPSSSDDRAEIWRLTAPTAGTANLVLTFSSAPGVGVVAVANTTNQSATNPEGTATSNSLTSTDTTDNTGHLPIDAGPGDLVIGVVGVATSPTDIIPGADGGSGVVEEWDTTAGTEQCEGFKVSDAATQLVARWDTPAAFAIAALRLRWRSSGPTDRYGDSVFNTDGLIGYWRLGEASGSTAADISGHGRDGTHTSVTYAVNAPLGMGTDTAIGYNGSSSKTMLPYDGGAFDFSGNAVYSIECWLYRVALSGVLSSVVVHHEHIGSHDESWGVAINPNAATIVVFRGGTTATNYMNSVKALALNEWHHVVCTYDGTTLRLYIDGTLDNSSASALSMPTKPFGPSIGVNTDGTAQRLTGNVDEVAIYNKVLGPATIASRYAFGSTAYVPPPAFPGVFNLDV